MALLAQRMTQLGTENAFSLGADIQRCTERGLDVIRFNLGEPDFNSPGPVNSAAIEQIEAGNSHYCDPAGILSLREAIAAHVAASRGLAVTPDQVVVTPGGKPSIGYALQTYVDPGDEVVYPSPGFPIYESWVRFVGATPVPIQLSEDRGFAFTAEELSKVLTARTKLIILCSPSNPTGGVLSGDDLSGIAEVIRRNGRPDLRVYSDEIYEDILFDGVAHRSISSFGGMAERTLLASGFSKSFAMTGWRLGYTVLPTPEEAAVFKQLNINIISCVPPFIQEAGREALQNPEAHEASAAMCAEFQRRRDWIVPALNDLPGIRCRQPKGAFYVFPNVSAACERLGILDAFAALPDDARQRTSPSRILQMFLLYRYGVATMDRNSFGSLGAEGQHFLRISIASSVEELKRGVERIAQALEDRGGLESFLEEETAWQ